MSMALFIHASFAIDNPFGQESRILEHVPDLESAREDPTTIALLGILLRNMSRARSLDRIYVVSSDQPCDDVIVDYCASLNIKTVNSVRIPDHMPGAFRRNKRPRLEREILKTQEPCGLYDIQACLSFCQDHTIVTAVMAKADLCFFLEPDFFDTLMARYAQECLFAYSLTIVHIPSFAGTADFFINEQQKTIAALKKRAQSQIETIETHNTIHGDQKQRMIHSKTQRLQALLDNANYGVDVAVSSYYERQGKVREALPELLHHSYMFQSVCTQRDVEVVRSLYATVQEKNARRGNFEAFYQEICETYQHLTVDYPGYLELELTNECQLACGFCPQPQLTRPRGFMDRSLYNKIIDEACDHVTLVNLSGLGEPLLHPDLLDMIRYAKDKKVHKLSVESNGLLLDASLFEKMIDAGLDILNINVNALHQKSPQHCDQLCDMMLETKNRHDHDIVVVLRIVNLNGVQGMIQELFQKWEFTGIDFLIVPQSSYDGCVSQGSYIDFAPIKRTPCRKVEGSLHVFWDGRCPYCHVYCDQADVSLHDHSIAEIFNRSSMHQLRRMNQFLAKEDPAMQNQAKAMAKKEGFLKCLDCKDYYQRDLSMVPVLRPYFIENHVLRQYTRLYCEWHQDQAEHALQAGNAQEAMMHWEQLLKINPQNHDVQQRLSTLSTLQENQPSAV